MLKVNVGLSRKIGEPGYGSRGGSVHLELELDSSLVAAPEQLQGRLRHLFGLVRTALASELQTAMPPPALLTNSPPVARTAGVAGGRAGEKRATPAQIKAICALARVKAVAVRDFADQRFGIARLGDLCLRQASQLIDELKDLPTPHPATHGPADSDEY